MESLQCCPGCAGLLDRIAALEAAIGSKPTPADIDPGRLYSVQEAADILCVKKTTAYALIGDGDLARIVVGRKGRALAAIRVQGSDLIEFLASRRSGGPAPKTSFKRLRAH